MKKCDLCKKEVTELKTAAKPFNDHGVNDLCNDCHLIYYKGVEKIDNEYMENRKVRIDDFIKTLL